MVGPACSREARAAMWGTSQYEVHAVHVGTHNDGARRCGPDPPVAYDAAHARGHDADRKLGTSCSHWFEDACGVAGQAVGAGQSERHQSAGESSA